MSKITIGPACEALNVTRSAMLKMIEAGEIKATKTKSKRWQFEQKEIDRLLNQDVDADGEDEIIALFKNSKKRRIIALFDELENGKGIARQQAEKRIAELEAQMDMENDDAEIDLEWDTIATDEARGTNED